MQLPKATEMSHQLVAKRLRKRQVVIDATAGNGHDAAFLAEKVGPDGKLFAIDVLADAIESTRKRLEEANLLKQATLIEDSHENLATIIPKTHHGKVRAIMFNLGYLPGSDKAVKTHWNTSMAAIRAGLEILAPGGIMTICAYPGHPEGAEEANALERFATWIDPYDYCAVSYQFLNLKNDPPFLVAIEKEK
ncbi:MAG: class I SAM-dependent methyltransferase [Verrucomicrobiota bacterium]